MKVPSDHPEAIRTPSSPPGTATPMTLPTRRRPRTMPATPRSLMDALKRTEPDPERS